MRRWQATTQRAAAEKCTISKPAWTWSSVTSKLPLESNSPPPAANSKIATAALSMPCAWAALACNASMEVPSFPAARMDWATWLPGQVKFLADELWCSMRADLGRTCLKHIKQNPALDPMMRPGDRQNYNAKGGNNNASKWPKSNRCASSRKVRTERGLFSKWWQTLRAPSQMCSVWSFRSHRPLIRHSVRTTTVWPQTDGSWETWKCGQVPQLYWSSPIVEAWRNYWSLV